LLKPRILTALVLGVAVAGAVFLLPPALGGLVLGILWVLGAWEWARFAGLSGGARMVYAGGVLVGILLALGRVGQTGFITTALGLSVVWWALALAALLLGYRKIPLGLVAVAGWVVLLPSWVLLAFVLARPMGGSVLAFGVLILVWAADIGAFFCGRRFGRRKLAPTVSPGKTWAGVIGGAGAAAVAGWVLGYAIPAPHAGLVLVAVITALTSIVGDLTVSLCKRNVGLKDSGSLLPGHGGVLDRIDSLMAALPPYVLGLYWLDVLP
jgi:phosphatidate cytidylyltransferase